MLTMKIGRIKMDVENMTEACAKYMWHKRFHAVDPRFPMGMVVCGNCTYWIGHNGKVVIAENGRIKAEKLDDSEEAPIPLWRTVTMSDIVYILPPMDYIGIPSEVVSELRSMLKRFSVSGARFTDPYRVQRQNLWAHIADVHMPRDIAIDILHERLVKQEGWSPRIRYQQIELWHEDRPGAVVLLSTCRPEVKFAQYYRDH